MADDRLTSPSLKTPGNSLMLEDAGKVVGGKLHAAGGAGALKASVRFGRVIIGTAEIMRQDEGTNDWF